MKSIINSELPEFNLKAYQNGEFKTITNSDLKGKWIILFFYPNDFCFVCPTELADMAEYYPEFQELGVEVYSVSADSHFAHKAWHESSHSIGRIQFPMLADSKGALAKALEVFIENEGITVRSTFLVNPEGKIKIAEYHERGIGRNAEELLRKVKIAIATREKVCDTAVLA